MTDREKYLTILDRFYRGRGGSLLTKDESEALDYAISSIKTDLKYDLLYEETKHIADADKMIESTTKNDDVVALNFSDDIDTPNKYQTADGKWHEGRIPTTKNDLGVDCISREQAIKQCGFGMTSLLIADNLRKLPPVAPQPIKGHWKLVQRGKSIDICCFNCEAVRIKEYAYNYTIDQLEEDMKEYLKHDDMRYCPYCGSDNREVEE